MQNTILQRAQGDLRAENTCGYTKVSKRTQTRKITQANRQRFNILRLTDLAILTALLFAPTVLHIKGINYFATWSIETDIQLLTATVLKTSMLASVILLQGITIYLMALYCDLRRGK